LMGWISANDLINLWNNLWNNKSRENGKQVE